MARNPTPTNALSITGWNRSDGRGTLRFFRTHPYGACWLRTLCAGAAIHPRMDPLPGSAAAAQCIAWRLHTATTGVELGAGHGRRHQSVRRVDDPVRSACGVAL